MVRKLSPVFCVVVACALLISCVTIVQSPSEKKGSIQETKKNSQADSSQKSKDECIAPMFFSCAAKVGEDSATITITNQIGYDIYLSGIRIGDEKGICVVDVEAPVGSWSSYTATIKSGCKNGVVGSQISKNWYIAFKPLDNKESDYIILNGSITAMIGSITQEESQISQEGVKKSIQIESPVYYDFGDENGYSKSDCQYFWLAMQTGEYIVDGKNKATMEGYMEFCYGKKDLPPLPQKTQIVSKSSSTFDHQVNINNPKEAYNCNSIELNTLVSAWLPCKNFNFCDKVDPYDLSVRKSSADAIANNLNSAYSIKQIIDVYVWAKENIKYQNVPLDNYAPYRPSETIYTKTGDCKNYAAVIASMIVSIGGTARIVAIPSCKHAFAEVLIGGKKELDAAAEETKSRYQQDITINIVEDKSGYWLILDGAGSQYPGTTDIKDCLKSSNPRYYSYSCISSDGEVHKRKWV